MKLVLILVISGCLSLQATEKSVTEKVEGKKETESSIVSACTGSRISKNSGVMVTEGSMLSVLLMVFPCLPSASDEDAYQTRRDLLKGYSTQLHAFNIARKQKVPNLANLTKTIVYHLLVPDVGRSKKSKTAAVKAEYVQGKCVHKKYCIDDVDDEDITCFATNDDIGEQILINYFKRTTK